MFATIRTHLRAYVLVPPEMPALFARETCESVKTALQIASGVCVFHVAPCLPQLRVKGAKKLRSPRAMRRWSGVRALPLRLCCKA